MIDTSLIFDGTIGSPPTGAAITVTAASTNVIDLLVARDLGADDVAELNVVPLTTFTSGGGTATLQIAFQASALSGSGFVNLLLSPVYATADLIAGSPIFRYELPMNQVLNDTNGVLAAPGRFLRLNYTVASGPFTAGSVFSYISARQDRVQYYTYPRNYTAPAS